MCDIMELKCENEMMKERIQKLEEKLAKKAE
jgi:hypothetical protein